MMRHILALVVGLIFFGGVWTTSAQTNFGDSGSSFSCSSSDSAITSRASARTTSGSSTIYIGYSQVSSGNYNPIIARFDNGVRTWCRSDYEQTSDNGRGIGVFWDGRTLIGVFTTTGNQPGLTFSRWTGNGWIRDYGLGGGMRISVLLNINPANGEPINGTYLKSIQTNNNANRLIVKGLAVTNSSVIVNADAGLAPLNIDRSPMTCSGTAPFIYTIEFTRDFSTALGAQAAGCVSSSPAPGSVPVPGIATQIAPASGTLIEASTVTFQWQQDPNATRYWLWVGDSSNTGVVSVDNLLAANVCVQNLCSYTVNQMPFGIYAWYVLAGNSLTWSINADGFFNWSTGAIFTYGPTVSQVNPEDGTLVSSIANWGRFNWQYNPLFDWYGIYVIKPNNATPHFAWYSAAPDGDTLTCSGVTCELDLHLELVENGVYTWFVVGWSNGAGAGPWSRARTLTVSLVRPEVPSGINIDQSGITPIITWPNDPNAGYYQIWVGTSDFTRQVYFRWNRSKDLCSETFCSLPLGDPGGGEYVVYIQAWGPGGFNGSGANSWSQPVSFTVSSEGGDIVVPPLGGMTSTSPGIPTFRLR